MSGAPPPPGARPRVSAGLLLYQRLDGELRVLLAHPGGPLFARRDAGHWSIPKGEVGPGEDLLAAARREFTEETGHPTPDTGYLPLGQIVQKGGKVVYAWAWAGEWKPERFRSNSFSLEWPPGSGRTARFPEVDRAVLMGLEEARRRIKPAQAPLLERLREILGK